jgi:hypothetical protein
MLNNMLKCADFKGYKARKEVAELSFQNSGTVKRDFIF